MLSPATHYRAVLRELKAATVAPRKISSALTSNFRAIIEKQAPSGNFRDVENAVLFMRSQRVYQDLLERYNPTVNYTSDERIKATTRRVGLQLPKTYDPSEN